MSLVVCRLATTTPRSIDEDRLDDDDEDVSDDDDSVESSRVYFFGFNSTSSLRSELLVSLYLCGSFVSNFFTCFKIHLQ